MVEPIEDRKRALRRELKARRRAMDPIERGRRSQALAAALLEHPLWRDAEAVAAFVGVRGEPETTRLLRRALDEGKRVFLPRVLGGGVMAFWPVDRLEGLEPRGMGLLEPERIGPGVPAPGPEHGVTCMLVPGLGFDRRGGRIGFGKAHYDRALGGRLASGASMPALVGVCFEPFVVDEVPTDRRDVAMHYLVTDRGLAACATDGR